MKKNELFAVQLNHLSHTDVASLFTQTCDCAITARNYLDEIANTALTSLSNSSSAFGAKVYGEHKSKFTELIIENRELSKNLISNINQAINIESKSNKEENILATQIFDFFFISYSNLPGSTLKHQMEQTQEMILKYKADPTLKSAAKIIGVATLLTELEADNNLLIAAFNMSKTNTNRNLSKEHLRQVAVESYIQFCTIIEQTLNCSSNDSLLSLFNNINELRKLHNRSISESIENETIRYV